MAESKYARQTGKLDREVKRAVVPDDIQKRIYIEVRAAGFPHTMKGMRATAAPEAGGGAGECDARAGGRVQHQPEVLPVSPSDGEREGREDPGWEVLQF